MPTSSIDDLTKVLDETIGAIFNQRTSRHSFILADRIYRDVNVGYNFLSSELSSACGTIHQTILLC